MMKHTILGLLIVAVLPAWPAAAQMREMLAAGDRVIDLVGFSILIPVFPLLISPGSPFRVTPADWTPKEGLIMLGFLQAVFLADALDPFR